MDPGSALQQFLQPLQVDNHKIHTLSRLFYSNFRDLAINAHDQFLPTPISESILRPVSQTGRGRYLLSPLELDEHFLCLHSYQTLISNRRDHSLFCSHG